MTTIDWFYDNLGRLTREVYDSDTDSRDYTADYLLDLVGNRREKNVDTDSTPAVLASYRSGTAMASGDVDEATVYTYDDNDRLLTETKDVDVAADDRHTVYAYGASDDITQQTRKTVTVHFPNHPKNSYFLAR